LVLSDPLYIYIYIIVCYCCLFLFPRMIQIKLTYLVGRDYNLNYWFFLLKKTLMTLKWREEIHWDVLPPSNCKKHCIWPWEVYGFWVDLLFLDIFWVIWRHKHVCLGLLVVFGLKNHGFEVQPGFKKNKERKNPVWPGWPNDSVDLTKLSVTYWLLFFIFTKTTSFWI